MASDLHTQHAFSFYELRLADVPQAHGRKQVLRASPAILQLSRQPPRMRGVGPATAHLPQLALVLCLAQQLHGLGHRGALLAVDDH